MRRGGGQQSGNLLYRIHESFSRIVVQGVFELEPKKISVLQHGVSQEDLLRGTNLPAVKDAAYQLASLAHIHLEKVRYSMIRKNFIVTPTPFQIST